MAESPISPTLVIDAASPKVWVGLLEANRKPIWETAEGDPTDRLFQLVTKTLRRSEKTLRDVASLIYCEGPGSALGIRTVAMAIRAWEGIGIKATQSLYCYNSLAAGSILARKLPGAARPEVLAIDARRDSWNILPVDKSDQKNDINLLSTDELVRQYKNIGTLSGFPKWTKLGAAVQEIEYDLPTAFGDESEMQRIMRRVPFAAPLSLRPSEFKKWTPQIHRSPQQ